MRPGPDSFLSRHRERSSRPRPRSWSEVLDSLRLATGTPRRGSLLISTVLLLGVPAQAALAQGGPGAERYEVTITPPKRPGSPPVASGDAPATAPGNPDGTDDDRPAADHVLGASEPASAGSQPEAGAPGGDRRSAAVAVEPAGSAKIDPNLPRRSLQVGAFRQRSLATAMQEKLDGRFPDVAVVEVQSGGTPLFRVNVGRLPKGPALSQLKDRLADSGYPSFDVPAPPVDVAD